MQDETGETGQAPVTRKSSRRIYWTPIAVFVLGLLSIVMLLWIDRISEGERTNFSLADVLMDIQIKTATSHIWLEEAISGDVIVDFEKFSGEQDIEKVNGQIDQAISLAEAALKGGKSEHGLPIKPLKDSKLRKRVEDIYSLLTQFKTLAHQRFQDAFVAPISPAPDKRFHAVYREIQNKAEALEIVLERNQIRALARSKRLFWSVLLAWTFIVLIAITGLWSREARRKAAEMRLEKANEQLQFRTEELEKYKGSLEELVEKRTMDLVTSNWQLEEELKKRGEIEKSLRASESQLQDLSSKLLSAQEDERKRISRELHDELGGALAFLRIEFTLLEKKLNEDQTELKERCRRNLEHLDQVTDNVSRLSRNLSPYLLEDLGLSAALRSLLSNFSKHLNIQVASDIPEIDHLFSQDAEITIYRIIQESLTNIGKHAQAQHVSMTIRKNDDAVYFTIEDDGRGFNVEQASRRDASERGMGLTTMEKRVRILGGSFNLWSQEGKGSRITFHIPKKNGETLS